MTANVLTSNYPKGTCLLNAQCRNSRQKSKPSRITSGSTQTFPNLVSSSVFQSPELTNTLREVLLELVAKIQPPVECVVGIDARGFLLGTIIAVELKVPFIPIRKRGKLPGPVASVSYALEYGEDVLEIQEGSIEKEQLVLVVDDLLATGGSLGAACNLVEKLGGRLRACLVLMELTELKGRSKVPADIISVIKY